MQQEMASSGIGGNGYLVLEEAKINRLINLSTPHYTTYKRILGVLGSDYDFLLTIKLWNGSQYNTEHEIGLAPGSTSVNVLRTDRYGLLNETWAHVVFNVWQQCSGVTC